MKSCIILLCSSFFLLSIAGTVKAEDDSRINDYLYLKQIGVDGIYVKVEGRFLDVTENRIYMKKGTGENLLFERKAVKHVRVYRPDSLKNNDKIWKKRTEWQETAKKYWNRESSLILTFLLGLPVLGDVLKFLNYLSASLANVLAFVILLPVIMYGIYRLYESSVISSKTRQMNNAKLELEIRKLRYDVRRIEDRLGISVSEDAGRLTYAADEKKPFYQDIEMPKLEILDFIKQKILRFPQEEHILGQKEVWGKRWEAYKNWNPWARYLVYSVHMIWNAILTIFAFLMGIGAIPNVFMYMGESEAGSLGLSLAMLGVFYGSIISLIKLKYLRKSIRETYQEAFKS
ncbi:MAG: hypothetical protein KAS66_03960 [Candidatus Omnitrophica bacterium]|nr:hypothetical protein [Candidatus Omnitrophota bacterium]